MDDVGAFEGEIRRLERKLVEMERKLERATREAQVEKSKGEKTLAELQGVMDTFENRAEEAELALVAERERRQEAEAEISRLKAYIKRVEATSQGSRSGEQGNASSLWARLSLASKSPAARGTVSETDDDTSTPETATALVSELRRRLADMELVKDDVQDDLDAARAELAKRKVEEGDLDLLREKCNALQADRDMVSKSLSKHIERIQIDLEGAREEARAARKREAELRESLNDTGGSSSARLVVEVEELRAEAEAQGKRLEEALSRVRAAAETLGRTEEECSALKIKVDEAEAAAEALQARLESAEAGRAVAERLLEETKMDLNAREAFAGEAQGDLSDALAESNSQVRAMEVKMESLEETLFGVTRDLGTARSAADEAIGEAEGLKKILFTLQNERDALRLKLEDSRERSVAEIQALQTQRDTARADLDAARIEGKQRISSLESEMNGKERRYFVALRDAQNRAAEAEALQRTLQARTTAAEGAAQMALSERDVARARADESQRSGREASGEAARLTKEVVRMRRELEYALKEKDRASKACADMRAKSAAKDTAARWRLFKSPVVGSSTSSNATPSKTGDGIISAGESDATARLRAELKDRERDANAALNAKDELIAKLRQDIAQLELEVDTANKRIQGASPGGGAVGKILRKENERLQHELQAAVDEVQRLQNLSVAAQPAQAGANAVRIERSGGLRIFGLRIGGKSHAQESSVAVKHLPDEKLLGEGDRSIYLGARVRELEGQVSERDALLADIRKEATLLRIQMATGNAAALASNGSISSSLDVREASRLKAEVVSLREEVSRLEASRTDILLQYEDARVRENRKTQICERLEEELASVRARSGANVSAGNATTSAPASARGAEWLQHYPGAAGAEAALHACLKSYASMEMYLGEDPDLTADAQKRVDSLLEEARQCALTAVSRFVEGGVRGSMHEILRALERHEAVLARAVDVNRAASSTFRRIESITRPGPGGPPAEHAFRDVSGELLPLLADVMGSLLQVKASVGKDLDAATHRLSVGQRRLLDLGTQFQRTGNAQTSRALPRSPALSRDEKLLLSVATASRSAPRALATPRVHAEPTAEADLSPMFARVGILAALTGRSGK